MCGSMIQFLQRLSLLVFFLVIVFFSVLIIQYCLFDCCRESRNVLICHGLRSSASPVLTATGVVNGRGQFLTPTESTPLDRSPKNLLLMITSATPMAVPNLVLIHPHRSSERRSCWHMTAHRWIHRTRVHHCSAQTPSSLL